MSGRWWRAYEDAAHDPKLQTLPSWVFKLWFNLLCLASKNDGIIPTMDKIRSVFPLPMDRINIGVKILLDRGLIDQIEGRLEPHNWRKRQYKSDTSAERMRRHRHRHSVVTRDAPETETETDRVSEDTNSRATSLFSDFWKAFPKRDGDNPKGKAETKFRALIEAGTDPDMLIQAAHSYAEQNILTERRYIPMAVTWLNEQRWQDRLPFSKELPTIKPGMPEWDAWERYYRDEKKAVPLAMQRVKNDQQKSMTVPTRWPEEFDSGYAAAVELKKKLDEKAG